MGEKINIDEELSDLDKNSPPFPQGERCPTIKWMLERGCKKGT